jgi:antirestriction protein
MKCYFCNQDFEEDELVECENCGELFCEDCMTSDDLSDFDVWTELCKDCAEEITGFDEDERDTISRSHLDISVFEAAKECGISVDDVEEAYQGEYGDDEDFVQQLLEDTGGIPSDLPSYIHIDWKWTAREVMQDYCEHDGYYFRNM